MHVVNDIGEQYSPLPKLTSRWSLLIPKTIEALIKVYLYWVKALMDIDWFQLRLKVKGLTVQNCCVMFLGKAIKLHNAH